MANKDHKITLTVDASYNWSYSGGNDGGGNVKNKSKDGKADIDISLSAPNGFSIVSIDISGEGSGQMSYKIIGGGKKAKIDNPCTEDADVYYQVNVVDSSTGTDVACDPKIVNR